ncbi:MAG: efflux RND transporter periplasmic adaptor subunit [Tepidisphaeraceae bacterium]
MFHRLKIAPVRYGCGGILLNLCALVMLVAIGGCQKAEGQPPGPPQGPPPEVGVVTIAAQRVELSTELPGRTTAFRVAEIRPQVSGIVLQRLFEEGAEVQQGQQLYKIDPARYQAAYDSAVAAQARSKAALTSATLTVDRYKKLEIGRDISSQDYDNAVAAQLQAEADVESAQAAVESARINLDYTRMFSPISGRTGRSSVTEGALVTAEQPASLVTIQQLDPIYVDLTQSSAQILHLQRELAGGGFGAGAKKAGVTLTLEDGTAYADTGVLKFSEVTVDQMTGSVTLRALFPNARRELLPGMFVRARVIEGVDEQAILIPQQAVARNARGEPTVLAVGEDGNVQLRSVKTDRAIGDKWLVTDGIKAGDKVIVEGLQKVAPGIAVRAVEVGVGQTVQTDLKQK